MRVSRDNLLIPNHAINVDLIAFALLCIQFYGAVSVLCSTTILTPWCRVLLEKLTGLQLVKKFPAFHGTRRFITALTSVYPGPAQSSPYIHIPPPGDPF